MGAHSRHAWWALSSLVLAGTVAAQPGTPAPETADLDRAATYANAADERARMIARATADNADPHVAAELREGVLDNAAAALALDPTRVPAYLALALAQRQFWYWDAAQAAYARALALAPDDPAVVSNYGWFSSFTDQPERAIFLAGRAVEHAPQNATARRDLGIAEAYAGHVAEAAAALEACTRLDPSVSVCHIYLGFMRTRLGDLKGAAESLRRTESLFGDAMTPAGASSLAHAYARAGLQADADRVFARLEDMAAERVVGQGSWPLGLLAVGRVDEAYAALAAAVEKVERHEPDEGFYNLMIIKANVQANPMLDEPRFVALRRRIGGG